MLVGALLGVRRSRSPRNVPGSLARSPRRAARVAAPRVAGEPSTSDAMYCRRRISSALRYVAGGRTSPLIIDSGSPSRGSWSPRPETKARSRALPVSRPARPTRCRYDATVRGSDASITVDRSPMSMPISSVGVATSTLGACGLVAAPLNPFSYSSRVSSSSRLVCSRAMTRCISGEA